MSNITNTEKISVFALSFNEVTNIDFFFESIHFADEILLLHFHSSDKLIETAKKFNIRIIDVKNKEILTQQKNFLDFSKNDTVLLLNTN